MESYENSTIPARMNDHTTLSQQQVYWYTTSLYIIILKSLYLLLCFFLGIIGNLLVIIAIFKYTKLQTVTNFFILNLAITDFMFSAYGIPFIFVTTIAKRWLLGNVVCELVGFLNLLVMLTSIWTLVMISINRYLNVAKPNDIKTLYTKRRTFFIIIAVWVFSGLISFPPFIGWSVFRPDGCFCTFDVQKSKSYTIFIGLFAYVLPFHILIVLYMRTYFTLNKHKKKTRSNYSNDNSVVSSFTDKFSTLEKVPVSSVFDQTNRSYTSIIKKESKCIKYKNSSTAESEKTLIIKNFKQVQITKTLIILVSGFFICWTPVALGSTLYTFDVNFKGFPIMSFGIFCACLSCVINPIIYSVMNSNFRKYLFEAWKKLCDCIRCKKD
ncbi:alpha-1A adrenergic receptor [Hydra vulgaris]|uniref:Alpha-1A adrenergic receptor n=1 Tax=Hydra vulgaris TaxID=6087 RepID=A0ABM4BTJ5_HYDVU